MISLFLDANTVTRLYIQACSFGYGEQMNQINHLVDGSVVYGNDDEDAKALRYTYTVGQIVVFVHYKSACRVYCPQKSFGVVEVPPEPKSQDAKPRV
jgi:hypothetical protein